MGQTHQKRIFWASFLTLIAAGVGFAVRGAILGDWAQQFGFTKTELGTITGGGLVGFGLIIILASFFVDRIGYKPLLVMAFVLHVLSAIITMVATPIFNSTQDKDTVYWCLYVGMFMFAIANGLCEAVINPLVATLYPLKKTHYLNILHAGWPGGLIVGGLFAYGFAGPDAAFTHLRWEIPMAFFLVPTVLYGLMILPEKFPISEVKAAGVTFGETLRQFLYPVLLLLLVLHALVGYVELGTDSWITNIMNNSIPGKAILLFIYTSALMFVLRFFAGPIVEKINPLGLLFCSAVLGAIGLYALGSVTTGLMIIVAATIYGVGKTFLWPTMLGVVGERFPKGGAVTMGMIGGIGMLSAGLLGGPGIGYTQDYYAAQNLEAASAETYAQYRAEGENQFLFFPSVTGLDGAKIAPVQEKAHQVRALEDAGEPVPADLALTEQEQNVLDAGLYGGRMALKVTALIPVTMAVGYLILIIYFRARGGYKIVELEPSGREEEVERPETGTILPGSGPAGAGSAT